MARSENLVILIGNIGQDAETKHTPGGTAVTNFSIATSRRWKDKNSDEWKEETEWHRVTLWQSENLAGYLKKGTQVYVKGRLQTRSYEKDGQKHYATDIVAETVNLLGGNPDGGGERATGNRGDGVVSRPRSSQPASTGRSAPAGRLPDLIDDPEVPF